MLLGWVIEASYAAGWNPGGGEDGCGESCDSTHDGGGDAVQRVAGGTLYNNSKTKNISLDVSSIYVRIHWMNAHSADNQHMRAFVDMLVSHPGVTLRNSERIYEGSTLSPVIINSTKHK